MVLDLGLTPRSFDTASEPKSTGMAKNYTLLRSKSAAEAASLSDFDRLARAATTM